MSLVGVCTLPGLATQVRDIPQVSYFWIDDPAHFNLSLSFPFCVWDISGVSSELRPRCSNIGKIPSVFSMLSLNLCHLSRYNKPFEISGRSSVIDVFSFLYWCSFSLFLYSVGNFHGSWWEETRVIAFWGSHFALLSGEMYVISKDWKRKGVFSMCHFFLLANGCSCCKISSPKLLRQNVPFQMREKPIVVNRLKDALSSLREASGVLLPCSPALQTYT